MYNEWREVRGSAFCPVLTVAVTQMMVRETYATVEAGRFYVALSLEEAETLRVELILAGFWIYDYCRGSSTAKRHRMISLRKGLHLG